MTEPAALARIPDEFFAGDRLKWDFSHADHPAGPSWNLTYYFAPADATASAVIEIASDGGAPEINKTIATGVFTAELLDATSLLFADNTEYQFTVRARSTGSEGDWTLEQGRILAKTNFSALSGNVDLRSTNKIILDQLRARITGRTLLDQNSMSIGNRMISRMLANELTTWEAEYATKVAYEVRRERIRRGLKTSRAMKVRFTG